MKAIAAQVRAVAFTEYLELTKPRITLMVILTALVGFLLASSNGPINVILLIHALLGTGLVAAGASALNMVLEWEADSRMRRTERRPIPSGKLSLGQAILFGIILAATGILYLFLSVNFLTALLAMISLGLYLMVYTPLKRKTPLCTIIGAIPGAIPPVMGWTAMTNSIEFTALWLFAILFLWQLPHFLAIAWLYRQDYARGGFSLLPLYDPDGTRTGRHIILQSISLMVVSILPPMLGLFGHAYLAGALILGAVFLVMAFRLAITKTNIAARYLLLTSVLYLPLLLVLMVADKL